MLSYEISQRLESTGERNRIHLSQDTADLLSAAGKGNWCIPRKDSVFAKGKGELKTYWLQRHPGTSHSLESDRSDEMACSTTGYSQTSDAHTEENAKVAIEEQRLAEQMANERRERLIDWNTDLLMTQLREIVAERMATESVPDPVDDILDLEMEIMGRSGTVLDEVQDIIRLPRFVRRSKHVSGLNVAINDRVRHELRDYVATLSALYHGNAFHNFEVRRFFSGAFAKHDLASHPHRLTILYSTRVTLQWYVEYLEQNATFFCLSKLISHNPS